MVGGWTDDVDMTRSDQPQPTDNNQVYLRGRLAAAPESRDLPSGDVLAVFRVTVPRPPGARARVDSIECVTARVRPRKSLARARPGDDIEIYGRLHRRFWRTPAGPASRYAVDVDTVRLTRPGRRGAASPAPTPASG
jgi:single-strand DNA-binding protein